MESTTLTSNAVLLIMFNRPEATERVFEAVRRARTPRLYLAADGPRPHKHSDVDLCIRCRSLVERVDWECEVRTLYWEENLGSARAIPSAIDWFYEHEEEGIVLEDDCLPCQGFFPYCDALLERYRNNELIWWINGSNFGLKSGNTSASYHYSRYPSSWGWASWRRAWSRFRLEHQVLKPEQISNLFQGGSYSDIVRRYYWRNMLQYSYLNPNWDYRWLFTCWAHGTLACVPSSNLIRNIGFGPGAVHTNSTTDPRASIPCSSIGFPLTSPVAIEPDPEVDRHFEHVLHEISTFSLIRAFIAAKAPVVRIVRRRILRR